MVIVLELAFLDFLPRYIGRLFHRVLGFGLQLWRGLIQTFLRGSTVLLSDLSFTWSTLRRDNNVFWWQRLVRIAKVMVVKDRTASRCSRA